MTFCLFIVQVVMHFYIDSMPYYFINAISTAADLDLVTGRSKSKLLSAFLQRCCLIPEAFYCCLLLCCRGRRARWFITDMYTR